THLPGNGDHRPASARFERRLDHRRFRFREMENGDPDGRASFHDGEGTLSRDSLLVPRRTRPALSLPLLQSLDGEGLRRRLLQGDRGETPRASDEKEGASSVEEAEKNDRAVGNLERVIGLEPTTSTLARSRSSQLSYTRIPAKRDSSISR